MGKYSDNAACLAPVMFVGEGVERVGCCSLLPGNLESFEAAKRADIVACGLLLAETFACGLADGPSGVMTPPTLRRLLFTVFPADVEGFRAYLHKDGHHERFAALLENAEARDFFHAMLYNTAQQQATALQLLQHDFLTSP
ncbi:hypothetical protein V8C86DRAFT_3031406 [Haematococcus lacustris]